jgi:small subunit ribosomal protein S5
VKEKTIVAEPNQAQNGETPKIIEPTAEPRAQPAPEQRGQRGGFRSRRNRPSPDGSDGGMGGKEQELSEKVVFINRSAKVVKGGRRFNFSALIVVGDRRGRVGVGLGKAGEVADAIRKGGEMARSQMVGVSLKDATIPHEVFSHYCGAKVLLRPASPGTGIIAGKTVRAVLESAGVKDVLSKSLGSKNAANVVKATLSALLSLRLREDIYGGRGLEIRKAPAPKPAEAAAPAQTAAAPAEAAAPEVPPPAPI